jgi:hypothetical protein
MKVAADVPRIAGIPDPVWVVIIDDQTGCKVGPTAAGIAQDIPKIAM